MRERRFAGQTTGSQRPTLESGEAQGGTTQTEILAAATRARRRATVRQVPRRSPDPISADLFAMR